MWPQTGLPQNPALGILSEQDPRLVRALAHVSRTRGADVTELHALVRETAVLARRERRTPESVIILFKRELERCVKQDMDRADYAVLVDRVVRWCLDQYFRAD